MNVYVGLFLKTSLAAQGAVSENVLLLNVGALLDPLPYIAGPIQLHTWFGQKDSCETPWKQCLQIKISSVTCVSPGLNPRSVSLAQENSEEISLEISLRASSNSVLSECITTGMSSDEGGGESSSFEWVKTEPTESRCTPLQSLSWH